jgi:hypothetical protein
MDEEYTLEEAIERQKIVAEEMKMSGLDQEVQNEKVEKFFMHEGI